MTTYKYIGVLHLYHEYYGDVVEGYITTHKYMAYYISTMNTTVM